MPQHEIIDSIQNESFKRAFKEFYLLINENPREAFALLKANKKLIADLQKSTFSIEVLFMSACKVSLDFVKEILNQAKEHNILIDLKNPLYSKITNENTLRKPLNPLYVAFKENKLDIIPFLLELGVKPNNSISYAKLLKKKDILHTITKEISIPEPTTKEVSALISTIFQNVLKAENYEAFTSLY